MRCTSIAGHSHKTLHGLDIPTSASEGITLGLPDEFSTALQNPRVVLNYQAVNSLPAEAVSDDETIQALILSSSLDTLDKIFMFRAEVLAFFETHYGVKFETDANTIYNITDAVPVLSRDGRMTDSFVSGMSRIDNSLFGYHGSSLCLSDASGSESKCTNATKAPLHDFSLTLFVGSEGLVLHGAFGGDQGQLATSGAFISTGIYVFEGLEVPMGTAHAAKSPIPNLEVKFFGECPLDFRSLRGPLFQGLYVNCALESTLFGKGRATGSLLYEFGIDGTAVAVGYPTMYFDDFVPNPVPSTKSTNLQQSLVQDLQHNNVRFSFIADGTYPVQLAAAEALPFLSTNVHHFTNEAAIEFFERRTSLRRESDMFGLRRQFLNRLVGTFGIDLDPSAYDDVPLDGIIDLGGGNTIMGYVVNEKANQRVLTRQGAPGDPTTSLPPASRLHEGGFRLVVGRSGLDTIDGRSPFGTTILEGIYVLENGNSMGEAVEIPFHSLGVIDHNAFSTSNIYHHLSHPEYGEGRLIASQPMPKVESNGLHLLIGGVMVFGNVGIN